MTELRFSGKCGVVSGASRGIGREVALCLASGGADVAVVARNAEALEAVAKDVEAMGRRALVITADLAAAGEPERVAETALAAFGRLDLLVNNAGITRDNLLLRMRRAEWDEVLAVDLTAVFLLTQACLKPMLRARYGRIVTVTSVVGLTGNAGQANYAAAKAGLIGFTKSLAKEVASRNITANLVAPGFVETDMTGSLGEGAREKLLALVPMARAGKAAEVAEAVAFLLSDAAGYVTGEILRVDGGMAM